MENLKKLIFIDNDDEKSAKITLRHATDFLKLGCKLNADYVDTIEVMGDLWRKDREDIFKLFFEGNTAIVTYSVYTKAPVYDSSRQLKMLLTTAGTCKISNRVYIDASGEMVKGLNRMISVDQLTGGDMFRILQAINNNFIVTYDSWRPKRVMVIFSDYETDVFSLVDCDLNEILETQNTANNRGAERVRK